MRDNISITVIIVQITRCATTSTQTKRKTSDRKISDYNSTSEFAFVVDENLASETINVTHVLPIQYVDIESFDQQNIVDISINNSLNILECLHNIRAGLLKNEISYQHISSLRSILNACNAYTVTDEKIYRITQEIELRAAVELAKIEKANG